MAAILDDGDRERRREQIATALASSRDLTTVKEVVRLGESFLAAQLQTALAADLRALTLAAVLAAIIAGVLGAFATLVASNVKLGWRVLPMMVFIACMLFALRAAISAARPTDFTFSGNNPANWTEDVGKNEDLAQSLAEQAALYAIGIERNISILNENHRCIRLALGWVLTSVGAAVGAELVVLLAILGHYGPAAIFG